MKREATIAVIGTGDMGSRVGAALARAGYRSVTALAGRGAHSRKLAADAGLEDVGTLADVVVSADVILSIVPPAAAESFAGEVADAIASARVRPVFADCNAIAPATVRAIGERFRALGVPFVDAGIVGRGPEPQATPPTRVFVSGPARESLLELATPEMRIIDMGDEIGAASAIKMAYASLNKGYDALLTAVLLAAERLGVRAELMREFELTQKDAALRMRARVPYLAATAERYAGEMREIAATYDAAGVTPLFHRGAEWVYARLATSALASETRATLPAQRSLDAALEAFTATFDGART